jgi:D-sedoheptulose 7-phosphate isomerase
VPERAERHFEGRAALLSSIAHDQSLLAAIEAVVAVSVAALRAGNKILFMGNGASAGDAQHLASDLVSRFAYDRPGLAGLALTTDTSALTAIGNDYGYERLFARQIEALGRPGDVALGISTSGRSANVLAGLIAARERGVVTVAMTGAGTSPIGETADHCLRIPSTESPAIQEGHMAVGHLVVMLIEEQMFPRPA